MEKAAGVGRRLTYGRVAPTDDRGCRLSPTPPVLFAA